MLVLIYSKQSTLATRYGEGLYAPSGVSIHPIGGPGHSLAPRDILRQPYRLETTLDLGVLVLVARCDASHEKA